jgi:hypothetical protein
MRLRGTSGAAGAGGLGYIGEGAVAVVVVEIVATVCRDVEIFEAVVVVVADGDAHAVADAFESGLFGDILEGSIFLLMVEAIPVLRPGLLRYGALGCGVGERGTVDEDDVEQAVIVVVEGRDAGAHRLHEVLVRGVRGDSSKVDAGICCDVYEACDGGGGLRTLRKGGVDECEKSDMSESLHGESCKIVQLLSDQDLLNSSSDLTLYKTIHQGPRQRERL